MINRRSMLAGAGAATLLALPPARLLAQATPALTPAAQLDEARIDALAAAVMARFETPGMAVALVRPGQPAFARGYGLRALGQPGRVDAHTLFAIASNTKAYTSALLAMLVDEGKLKWDAPVQTYLPEFQLYDPVATKMMTVRDLLIHNSGLPLGAGDLMNFPATTHTLEDILHGLRYLKPATGFRTAYAYDNNLYLVAGMIVTRLMGMSWPEAVHARILGPLGMKETVAGFSGLAGHANVAGRHARLGPPLRGMGPLHLIPSHDQDKIVAAGGLNTNAAEATAWLSLQLAHGQMPDGKRLWSEEQAKEMWRPRTITASGPGADAANPARSPISAYALGWGVTAYRGQRLLAHSGALLGQITHQALLPELGCAVAVYSNVEEGEPSIALRNSLLDALIGVPAEGPGAFDWIASTAARRDKQQAEALKQWKGAAPTAPEGGPSLPLAAYAGRYRDPWYGDIVVSLKGKALAIDFTRTPAFKGPLQVWGADAFRTRFTDMEAEDAVVTFHVENGKVARVTMKALSPLADFSYDFHDLDFTPAA